MTVGLPTLVTRFATRLNGRLSDRLPLPPRLPATLMSGYWLPLARPFVPRMAMVPAPLTVKEPEQVTSGVVRLETCSKPSVVAPLLPAVRLAMAAVLAPPALVTVRLAPSLTVKPPPPACSVEMTSVPLLTTVLPE